MECVNGVDVFDSIATSFNSWMPVVLENRTTAPNDGL